MRIAARWQGECLAFYVRADLLPRAALYLVGRHCGWMIVLNEQTNNDKSVMNEYFEGCL